MSDGRVIRLHPSTRKVMRLTNEERQLLLDELAEIAAELDELQDRTAEIARRVSGPSSVRQARPASGLMTRMGHDDERAALIYQHASDKADQAIARGIEALVKAERKPDDGDARQASRCRWPNCTLIARGQPSVLSFCVALMHVDGSRHVRSGVLARVNGGTVSAYALECRAKYG
jgi:hypothetical protein